MTTTPLGVVRTMPQHNEDEPGLFGEESPRSWDVISGRKVRNDGVYPAILIPGDTYNLAHDGIGWQLTSESTRPHAYLTDNAVQPVDTLELAHRMIVLDPGRRYSIEQDETGAWRLLAHTHAAV